MKSPPGNITQMEAWAAQCFPGTFHFIWGSMPKCLPDNLSRYHSSNTLHCCFQLLPGHNPSTLMDFSQLNCEQSLRAGCQLELLTNIPGLLSFLQRATWISFLTVKLAVAMLTSQFSPLLLMWLELSFLTCRMRKHLIQRVVMRMKWACKAPRTDTARIFFSFSFSHYCKQNQPLPPFHSQSIYPTGSFREQILT